ncbi:MAG: hypothetical protein CK426_05430 [Legionella sp.]|nr:MAG: hypothetical protein CK423_08715 [Legionella sp.]PJD98638.1 MAG: hypothetical protein CK426_05430 [Legionella sp.]
MASEIGGCSARHIQSLIKKGRLFAKRDDRGNYHIDKSEFYRVVPDAHTNQKKKRKKFLGG